MTLGIRLGLACLTLMAGYSGLSFAAAERLFILPEAGRSPFIEAFESARREIRIEICVLEDPTILAGIQSALKRGVRVRAIVDRGRYDAIFAERANLSTYLTAAGGELHLSNPIFPRSFPKIILIDQREFLLGSACLDTMTFEAYRDVALRSRSAAEFGELSRLFENDWAHSAPVGESAPPFNPTPRLRSPRLLVAPVTAGQGMVRLYQQARTTLDVYSEILGNPTLESELAAAVSRGVRVRLIAPVRVNGMPEPEQKTQLAALDRLKAAGVIVHVSGPVQDLQRPYMHARAAIVDGRVGYVGSISLSPDSITFNREAGLKLSASALVRRLADRFNQDFQDLTRPF